MRIWPFGLVAYVWVRISDCCYFTWLLSVKSGFNSHPVRVSGIDYLLFWVQLISNGADAVWVLYEILYILVLLCA